MKNRMIRKTSLSLAISMVMAYPMTLSALGLGELHSSSQLNQPLKAQIDLLSTNAKEAGQLQVRLASPDVFNRVGIDRPAFLNSLKFTPTVQNGKPVIRVSSSAPISEPFLNFLLEVSWPQGQLLKEYTVLLDPPVLMSAGNASTDTVVAVRAEPKSTGVVNRDQQAMRQQAQQQRQRQLEIQRQQQATASASNQDQQFNAQAQAVLNETSPAPAVASTPSRSTKYRVKRGDTMSRIASRLRYRGVSNNQMMVALFRANPQAFSDSNINNLKTGALLSKPSNNMVKRSSHSESRQIVKQHYNQWKKYRSELANNTVAQTNTPITGRTSTYSPQSSTSSNDQANLSVVGSDKSVASGLASSAGTEALRKQLTLAQEALASSKSESAELHSRVSKLEAIIRKKERLITLKNERLAKLESQLISSSASVEADETDVNGTDLVQQVANQANQSNNRIIRGDENVEAADKDIATEQPTANTVVDTTVSTEEKDDVAIEDLKAKDADLGNGILGLLSSPLVAAIGVGSLLALLFGWLLMRRSSEKMDVVEDSQNDDDFHENTDTSDFADTDVADTDRSPIIDDIDDIDTLNEAHQRTTETVDENDADAFDNILQGDDSYEEDEILQEADVYIVYGLHEQAEDELKKAIADNPAKLEYRYKLLENYKAAGDSESFVTSAKDFLNAEGENKQQLWDKIVDWGKETVPENDLFSESSVKKAVGMVAGVASIVAATHVAKEAFSSDAKKDNNSVSFDLDNDDELNISGLDDEDFNLDIGDDLGADLDLGDLGDDDFGLDELAKDFGIESSSNVVDFGSSATSDNDIGALNLDLELDQNSDLDKVLPTGNAYTQDFSDDQDENLTTSNDDNLDDALSFLDLSDDDEEVQQAHIGTKLDLARAYLDMGDVEGARHTLEEVVIEGNDDQKREAEELLLQTG